MTTFRNPADVFVVLNYGAGVDSTAMLVELVRRYRAGDVGARPDVVIFADTGAEKPATYAYLDAFDAWLVAHGFPAVTRVRRVPVRAEYLTIEGNCLQNETLPSLAFGRKSCSLKWKAEPMDAHLAQLPAVRDLRARGMRPTKLIGYDCSPADSKRAVDVDADAHYAYRYPLREWGHDRRACIAAIEAEGLPVPPKSACFFCPASKPEELFDLARTSPELFARAIAIEDKARPHLRNIDGLWRRPRKSDGRPGSWRAFAEMHGLPLPENVGTEDRGEAERRQVRASRGETTIDAAVSSPAVA